MDGNWSIAVNFWTKCLSKAPGNLCYALELAIAQREDGQYEVSLATLEQAEARHGTDCWIHDNRARVYLASDEARKAYDQWQLALALAGTTKERIFFEEQVALAERHLPTGAFDDALLELRRAFEQGDAANALARFAAEPALHPVTELQADRLAEVFKTFGAHQALLTLWQAFAQLHPASQTAHLKLAITCREVGAYDRSQAVLDQMIRRFGDICWIQDNLARLRVLQGQRRQAEEHWSHAVRLAPDATQRAEFESLIRRSRESVTVNVDEGCVVFTFADSQSPDTLHLAVDGEPCADVQWSQTRQEGTRHLQARLPDRYLDGNPHLFEARDAGTQSVLGVQAALTTVVSISWQDLLKYSRAPFPGHLSPMAQDRYRNLQCWLQESAVSTQGLGIPLVQLALAHEILLAGFEQPRRTYPMLHFPIHETPTVSVVVPVHNRFAMTYYCLAALLFAYHRASFEVILVDDGSTDETLSQLPEVATGITCLRHPLAQGFVSACNAGAQRARGEYLVFLNNDTEPTAHWLDELLYVLRHGDAVGLVGSKLLYPDGRLQEAGGIVWANGDPWNYGRGGNAHDPRYNYTREVDYVSGAAIMLPRALWERLGGFSPEFAPAYFEDTDLAFKVKAEGLRVAYAPLSRVYHFEGQSCGTQTETTTGLKRFQEINRPKFKRKWPHLYRQHGAYGVQPDREKDRNVRCRILFIDAETPRPDRDAGSYAAIQELRLIQSFGAKIAFLPINLAYMGSYTEDLQRQGIEMLYAPFYLSVEEALTKRGGEFDAVYITRYYVARDVLPLVRTHMPQARVMFCNADLHFLRQLRAAAEQGNDPTLLQEAVQTRDEELIIMRSVDVTLSYNSVEHAVVHSHNLNSSKVVLCPWVVDSVEPVVPYAERQAVAFLGNYRHPPNHRAVEFFATEVLPLLRTRDPDLIFEVYGSHADQRLETLAEATPGMKLMGWVEDVRQVYERCRVFVAPLRSGAGIKGKVIGALGYGLPQVLSPIAAEGTGLRDGLEVRIAETPQQWCEAVLCLYEDPEEWQRMSQAALAYAKTQFSFARGRDLMRSALAEVGIYVTDEDRGLLVWPQTMDSQDSGANARSSSAASPAL